jgi:hypothetical protein
MFGLAREEHSSIRGGGAIADGRGSADPHHIFFGRWDGTGSDGAR